MIMQKVSRPTSETKWLIRSAKTWQFWTTLNFNFDIVYKVTLGHKSGCSGVYRVYILDEDQGTWQLWINSVTSS